MISSFRITAFSSSLLAAVLLVFALLILHPKHKIQPGVVFNTECMLASVIPLMHAMVGMSTRF